MQMSKSKSTPVEEPKPAHAGAKPESQAKPADGNKPFKPNTAHAEKPKAFTREPLVKEVPKKTAAIQKPATKQPTTADKIKETVKATGRLESQQSQNNQSISGVPTPMSQNYGWAGGMRRVIVEEDGELITHPNHPLNKLSVHPEHPTNQNQGQIVTPMASMKTMQKQGTSLFLKTNQKRGMGIIQGLSQAQGMSNIQGLAQAMGLSNVQAMAQAQSLMQSQGLTQAQAIAQLQAQAQAQALAQAQAQGIKQAQAQGLKQAQAQAQAQALKLKQAQGLKLKQEPVVKQIPKQIQKPVTKPKITAKPKPPKPKIKIRPPKVPKPKERIKTFVMALPSDKPKAKIIQKTNKKFKPYTEFANVIMPFSNDKGALDMGMFMKVKGKSKTGTAPKPIARKTKGLLMKGLSMKRNNPKTSATYKKTKRKSD
jgi:hypothetical protein